MTTLTPADRQALAAIRAELRTLVRYDDESIVHTRWIRQRYDCGCYPSLAPARRAAVQTAWHEAGHAVAALAVGARFSSASIHHGHRTEGRVHGITGAGRDAFVVDAGGQIGEQLMSWSLPDRDADLQAWLTTWRGDGGDARRFRRSIAGLFGGDEVGAWRYSENMMTPLRQQIRLLARALLVHPRHVSYNVAVTLAAG